jgi:hypothetical protein
MLSAIALDSGSGLIKELRERTGHDNSEDSERNIKKERSGERVKPKRGDVSMAEKEVKKDKKCGCGCGKK